MIHATAARGTARSLPTHRRMAILHAAADRVEADCEALARLLASEGIKTIREARIEVARCSGTLRLCAEEARRLGGETIQFDQSAGLEGRFGYSVRVPVGVILAITPFNDPLNLVAHKIGPAIAAGNAVILKPHERTPLSALRFARILLESGLPPSMLQVLTGQGDTLGARLVEDARVQLVSFTGGTATGHRIARNAGLKKLEMELGSNCPTIVLADADLDRAAAACAAGAYAAAGQNCLHVQRIIVDERVIEPFRERLRARVAKYRLGPKRHESTDMGCLIDLRAAERVQSLAASAIGCGANLIIGGEQRGTAIPPMLLEGVPLDHAVVRSEVFGPVTVLMGADDLEPAIRLANDSDFGLQAAIFTNDLVSAHRAIDRLDVGAVIVNDSTDFRLDAMPFGGTKMSGLGREGVRSSVQAMTESKVACFNLGGAAKRDAAHGA